LSTILDALRKLQRERTAAQPPRDLRGSVTDEIPGPRVTRRKGGRGVALGLVALLLAGGAGAGVWLYRSGKLSLPRGAAAPVTPPQAARAAPDDENAAAVFTPEEEAAMDAATAADGATDTPPQVAASPTPSPEAAAPPESPAAAQAEADAERARLAAIQKQAADAARKQAEAEAAAQARAAAEAAAAAQAAAAQAQAAAAPPPAPTPAPALHGLDTRAPEPESAPAPAPAETQTAMAAPTKPKAAAAPKAKPKPKPAPAKAARKTPPPEVTREVVRDEPAMDEPSRMAAAPSSPPAAFPIVRVESIRWHPVSERRVVSLKFEQENATDAHEGDIVAGVLVYRIDPGAVELRVGSTSRVIRPVP
jgi:hypothetical protein